MKQKEEALQLFDSLTDKQKLLLIQVIQSAKVDDDTHQPDETGKDVEVIESSSTRVI